MAEITILFCKFDEKSVVKRPRCENHGQKREPGKDYCKHVALLPVCAMTGERFEGEAYRLNPNVRKPGVKIDDESLRGIIEAASAPGAVVSPEAATQVNKTYKVNVGQIFLDKAQMDKRRQSLLDFYKMALGRDTLIDFGTEVRAWMQNTRTGEWEWVPARECSASLRPGVTCFCADPIQPTQRLAAVTRAGGRVHVGIGDGCVQVINASVKRGERIDPYFTLNDALGFPVHGDDWVHVREDEVPKSPISGELVFKGGWVINPRAETGGYKLHATSPDSEVYAMLRRFRKVVQEGGRACLTPEEAQLINRHYCLVTKAGDKINLFVTYDVAQKIKGVAPRGADRDKPRTHRRDSGHEYGWVATRAREASAVGPRSSPRGGSAARMQRVPDRRRLPRLVPTR